MTSSTRRGGPHSVNNDNPGSWPIENRQLGCANRTQVQNLYSTKSTSYARGQQQASGSVQVPVRGFGTRIILSEQPLAVSQDPLVQGDGLIETARRLIGPCKIAAGADRVGMVVSVQPLAVSQDPLVQGDGLIETARRLIGPCKIAAGADRVGMVVSVQPLAVSQDPLVQGDGLIETARRLIG